MKRTLWEVFLNAYFSVTSIPWRIYGNHSHRLLCKDYGSLRTDGLDDLQVVKCTKKKGYWRIVVAD
jgi:hypothetical protein